jgi:hydroxymethylbilane synthase
MRKLIVGSRKSRMAIAQTNEFIDAFLLKNPEFLRENIEIKTITTSGDINQKDRLDLIGGKGLFVKEIEQMLFNNEIDVAVHSMKDMPTNMTAGLKIAAWLPRGNHLEALVNNSDEKIMELKTNSIIGTSSIRRRSQILNLRSDLCVKLIRGNVDTRVNKLNRGEYDALILGYGGLKRLDLESSVSQIFTIDEILPPACQASIGAQTIDGNNEIIKMISNTNHNNASIVGNLERNVLKVLQANCNSPIGVFASINNKKLNLKVELFSHDGKEKYIAEGSTNINDHKELATKVGNMIIDQVGIEFIKELDILEDDFNYTP